MKKIMLFGLQFVLSLFILSAAHSQVSQLIQKNISAPSLQNNKLGIPINQLVIIYLPPSYASSSLKYPVVYFLPGFGDEVQYWTNGTYQGFKLKDVMDKLITDHVVKEFIVVIVNGYNFMGGSFYVNSSVTGNWEDFATKDVVEYIDENYRTMKDPASRGISGHSMGGFGALNLAIRHPELYHFVYCLSPGLFDTTGLASCQLFKSQSFINQFIQKEQEYTSMSFQDALAAFKNYIQARYNSGDWDTPFGYAYGAAFSPNADKPIPCIDYPYTKSDNQTVVDSTKLQNYENGFGGLAHEVIDYKNNLLQFQGITIEYGVNDEFSWIPKGCKYFTDLLTAQNIPHNVVTFKGGHQDHVGERFKGYLLPFFSAKMSFDTTQTDVKLNQVSPQQFKLYPNYPNPFSRSSLGNVATTISYSIPQNTFVSLKVIDILGREIKNLVNENQVAGQYHVQYRGDYLSSGVYFVKLEAGNFVEVEKISLVK
jgi:S-formylglutathione hydrolase